MAACHCYARDKYRNGAYFVTHYFSTETIDMRTIAKILFPTLMACLFFNGEAGAAEKSFCYYHHNCPADGKLPKGQLPEQYTKRQCTNGGGKSWGEGPKSCENVND